MYGNIQEIQDFVLYFWRKVVKRLLGKFHGTIHVCNEHETRKENSIVKLTQN